MSSLVAAVSNAGGLGVMGAATLGPDLLRREIQRTRELTDKPFAVDLLAPDPNVIRDHMKVIFEEKIKIFVAGLAVPSDFIQEMHEQGMTVVVMCGKVRHAVKSAEAGADMVVAQGTEAGGHTGEVGTMALVPQVVDAVDIPVLAAGGITDGRGVAAALALGAQGVVIGTRFIATREAAAAPTYQRMLVEGREDSTIRTRCYTGKPARAVRNAYNSEWETRPDEIKPFPEQIIRSAELGLLDYMGVKSDADAEKTFLPAGQGLGMINSVESAEDVVRALVKESEKVSRSMGNVYDS